MLITIGIAVLAFVACALLAWALRSFAPFAAGALGIIILNIPGAHWIVQGTALGLAFACLVVSCVNQRKVPEGTARTEAQKRSESRADRYAIYAVLVAVAYTALAWPWLLHKLGEFFVWLWKSSLDLNLPDLLRIPTLIIVGIGVLAVLVFWRVRRARRRARQQTTSGSPAPAANLSSVS